MTNYFQGLNTVHEIKSHYRQLARENHPDLGGDEGTMKVINNQYEQTLKACDGQTSKGDDGKEHTYKYNKDVEQGLMNIIYQLLSLKIEGDILLIGTWVWILGNTKPHKEQLKELGCLWHSKRGCWYYRAPEQGQWRRHGNGSLADLAAKYGVTNCDKFKDEEKTQPKRTKRAMKA